MKEMALVSIVIPVYNAEAYLEKNIKCVLNQTYSNVEVIYVCDGCTDGSVDILQRYIYDKRIRVINRSFNLGAAESRNQGAKEAKGQWIIFWDADDIAEDNAIELMYKAAITYSADMVICSYGIIGEEKDYGSNMLYDHLRKIVSNYPLYENKGRIPDLSSLLICNAPFNKLISRRLLEVYNICFQDIKNSNDVFFSVAVFLCSTRIAYVDKKLYWYRNDSKGNLSSKRLNVKSYILEALDLIHELVLRLGYNEDIFQKYAFGELMAYRGTKVFQQLIDDYNNVYINKWGPIFDKEYLFGVEDIQELYHKRVVIYGAGRVGKDYYKDLQSIAEIVGWVDSKYEDETIQNVRKIKDMVYDFIVIATRSNQYAYEMKNTLLSFEVDPEKIIVTYPINVLWRN